MTSQLAGVMASTRYEDLPPETIVHARRAVLDWLGSALAGSVEAPARMAQRVVAGFGVSGEATVFSAGRASAAGAALANGVASHILEFDDVHKGSTLHAAAPIIPAALAVAERQHASGREFLTAVVLGYETAFRIGEAVNPSHYRYWHPTGTVATFGAAVAAGSLIGLDAARMADALGSAGTQAAGLWEFNADGSMSKHLHPGKAAFHGVLSADLARAGFTGARRILEGDRGFLHAMSTEFDERRIIDGLGTKWKIGENCYKLHSCCGHTHTAIDCAIESGLAAGQIAEIEIRTYGPGYAIVREMQPRTPYQAKFSSAYCVARAILDGRVGLAQFAPAKIEDDAVRELLGRIRVSVDDDLTSMYPVAWPARLIFRLRDGRMIEKGSDFPRGNPENPVSTEQLEEKFVALAGSRGLDAVRAVEECADMASLFRNL